MRLRWADECGELLGEFEGVSLRDSRLEKRLRRIVTLAGACPSDSFPEQMESVADREALYRFLSNSKMNLDSVLGGHIRQTHERIGGRRVVRVVHDTSTFHFPGERNGTVFRTVYLNPRSKQKQVRSRGAHPARTERMARLKLRWGQITIGRQQYSHSRIHELSFSAVHVFEPKPPKGEGPIE